jgi:hypothetical protein
LKHSLEEYIFTISECHNWKSNLGDGGSTVSGTEIVMIVVKISDAIGNFLDLVKVPDNVLVGSLIDLHFSLTFPVVEPIS